MKEIVSAAAELSGGRGLTLVYVDSGSTDGSVELARNLGVDVVNSITPAFTAAAPATRGSPG